MFDLQKGAHDKKKSNEFFYETEKDMRDPKKAKELKDKVNDRIQKLKLLQRSGGADKDEFEMINKLLLAYESIIKVLARIKIK